MKTGRIRSPAVSTKRPGARSLCKDLSIGQSRKCTTNLDYCCPSLRQQRIQIFVDAGITFVAKVANGTSHMSSCAYELSLLLVCARACGALRSHCLPDARTQLGKHIREFGNS